MSSVTLSTSATSGAQATQGSHHHHGGGALAVAAKALGMSKSDVRSALASGKSLDDLAQAKGVSHDDLVKALKAGMPKDLQNSSQADAIAEKIATTKGVDAVRPPAGAPPAGGPGGPPPGPPPSDDDSDDSTGTGIFGSTLTSSQSKTLDKLAELLGTDSTSLLDTLKSGTSLSDLVQKAGIDSSKLASVLQDGLFVDTSA
jgi:lambda repressor-like predicted transcriptional regulator